jgi:hypothetical protein
VPRRHRHRHLARPIIRLFLEDDVHRIWVLFDARIHLTGLGIGDRPSLMPQALGVQLLENAEDKRSRALSARATLQGVSSDHPCPFRLQSHAQLVEGFGGAGHGVGEQNRK